MKLSREQIAALRAAYAAGAAPTLTSTTWGCRDVVAALDELIELRERHRKRLLSEVREIEEFSESRAREVRELRERVAMASALLGMLASAEFGSGLPESVRGQIREVLARLASRVA